MKEFATIENAILDIKKGKMLIVIDDEDRENEGDFFMPAECITTEAVNFMARQGRGLICTPITEKVAEKFNLPPMVQNNDSLHETAFTISIDHIDSGTGISAQARALTIKKMTEESSMSKDFVRPGHIFPLVSKAGGVLQRAGHTEAAVDLAELAGFSGIGVICEIMNEDGTMARVDDLFELAKKFDLKIITIKDLISYQMKNKTKKRVSEKNETLDSTEIDFPCEYGDFKLRVFETPYSNNSQHHVAMIKGDVNTEEPVLVRVHSECFTGDIFGSKRCDCGDQLAKSMEMIENAGCGVLLYMRQEGRGIGLVNKIRAYQLQDQGHDTVEANRKLGFKDDLREYGIGAQILKTLGIKKMKLLTNNPKKIVGLEGFDLKVDSRCSIEIPANKVNLDYLKTKRDRMGHMLEGLQ